jgi:hypothetical protein
MLATSALDNESEKIVQDALDRAAQGMLDKRQLLFYDSGRFSVNRSNNIGNCASFIDNL